MDIWRHHSAAGIGRRIGSRWRDITARRVRSPEHGTGTTLGHSGTRVGGGGPRRLRAMLALSSLVVGAVLLAMPLRVAEGQSSTPVVSFASSSMNAYEDLGSVSIALNVSPAPTGTMSVGYTLSGTATRDTDYSISGVTSNSGTVSVGANATSASISVTLVDDPVLEDFRETVLLSLSAGTGYTVGDDDQYQLNIEDNEIKAMDFRRPSGNIVVGDSATHSFKLVSKPTGTVTVSVTVDNEGVTAQPTSVTFNPSGSNLWNQFQSVTLLAADDAALVGQTVRVTTAASGGGYDGMTSGSNFTITDGSEPDEDDDDEDDSGGTNPSPAPTPTRRTSYVYQDPPGFCRGTVQDVLEPVGQAFPTHGSEVPSLRPCSGSGMLDLSGLGDALDDDQLRLQRGVYITTQLHSIDDYRSRFRGGASSDLYVVVGDEEQRYEVVRSQRIIDISVWLIRRRVESDLNTVEALGRRARLSEEFVICLPDRRRSDDGLSRIAVWDRSELSWRVLPSVASDEEQMVCAGTDQFTSFILVRDDTLSEVGAESGLDAEPSGPTDSQGS